MATDIAKATLADGGAGILIILLVSLLLGKLTELWKGRRLLKNDLTEQEPHSTTGTLGTRKCHSDKTRQACPQGETRDMRPPPRPLEPLITRRPLPAPKNTQGGQWAA